MSDLPIGARLVLRCRKDWREAVVSRIEKEKIALTVFSISGKTYRVRRPLDARIVVVNEIPVLSDCESLEWREHFVKADWRW
ncbi:MAG: hypothetical protein H7Z37_17540 [Pyrinomonadaceae bacterium]|nr:hypothetical protein [Pyrinomonadaceae bacterium]